MDKQHHRLNGHECEQTPGDSEGQRSLVCRGPSGSRVRHNLPTEQQWQCILIAYLFHTQQCVSLNSLSFSCYFPLPTSNHQFVLHICFFFVIFTCLFFRFPKCVLSCSVLSTLCDPTDCSPPIYRQEYWNGLPFPSSGDLPNPGIELMSPSLAGGFFTTESLGNSPHLSDRQIFNLAFYLLTVNAIIVTFKEAQTQGSWPYRTDAAWQ